MKKLTLALFLLISATAHSALWIEPYLGYRLATDKFTVSNLGALNGDYETGATGMVYGAKAGLSMMGIAAGIHYEMGQHGLGDLTAPGGAETPQTDEFDTTNIGAFATFTLMPLLNFTASYYFSAEREETVGTDIGEKTKGSGFGIGAGFTGLPFLSINAEYRMITYDEVESVGGVVTTFPTSTTSEPKESSIVVSISVPFDI